MKTPTFSEQSGKIIQAYYRDEIEAGNPCGCFIGNLLNRTQTWLFGRDGLGEVRKECSFYAHALESIYKESCGLYTVEEIIELEALFMTTVEPSPNHCQTEETLYEAMVVTLQRLKELHELKGETVSDYSFTKRTLTA